MLLSDAIEYLQKLHGSLGDVDVRWMGLHNTYSPDAVCMTLKLPTKKADGTTLPMTIILGGHPENAWPLPDMNLDREEQFVL